jgi:hypothetical protein
MHGGNCESLAVQRVGGIHARIRAEYAATTPGGQCLSLALPAVYRATPPASDPT